MRLRLTRLQGSFFEAVFVFSVQNLDSEAKGNGVGFRFLVAPGVAALWPLFFSRWLRQYGTTLGGQFTSIQ